MREIENARIGEDLMREIEMREINNARIIHRREFDHEWGSLFGDTFGNWTKFDPLTRRL